MSLPGNSEVRVIGLDPSLSATGIADWDGSLETVGGDSKLGDRRLAKLYDAVTACLLPGVHLAVIEDLPSHAMSAGLTGRAQGVVRLALVNAGVPYATVVPATLKKYATGRGNADKGDMRMELFKRTGVDIRDDNQVDAWWLRAAGMAHLGSPLVDLPATHSAALSRIAWPELETAA